MRTYKDKLRRTGKRSSRDSEVLVIADLGTIREVVSDAVATAIREVVVLYPQAPAASGDQGESQDFLTAEEVGEILQIKPRTVLQRVRKHGLPALRIGKSYRFRGSEVLKWAEAEGSGQ